MNKKRYPQLSIELIGSLYIIIIGGLCYLLPMPDMIKGFLGLPGFFVIPYSVGKITLLKIRNFLKIDVYFEIISRIALYWCIGIITIVITAYFLNYIWFFYAESYTLLIIILMLICIFHNEQHDYSESFLELYGGIHAILFSLIIGITAFLFVTHFSPYPYEGGGDSLTHNYFSMLILGDNFFYFTAPYLLSLSLLTSIIIQTFNIDNDPYVLWWLARLILYLAYALGLYLYSYNLSNKRSLSLVATIIGIFVLHHNSGLVYLNDFAPKAIITILFPYLLIFIHKSTLFYDNQEFELKQFYINVTIIFVLMSILFFILQYTYNAKHAFSFVDSIGIILPTYFISVLFCMKLFVRNANQRMFIFTNFGIFFTLLIIHTAMGFVASILLLLYSTIFVIYEKHKKFTILITYLVMFIVFLSIFLQKMEFVTFSDSLFRIYDVVNPGFDGFHNMFRILGDDLYSSIVLYLFVIGCLVSVFYKQKSNIPLLFLVSTILIFLFAPLSSMCRVIVFFNPILAFFASYGLNKIYNIFFTKVSPKQHLYVGFIIIVLITSVIGNSTNEINKVVSEYGVFSYAIHEDVYLGGAALKNNTNENTFVICSSTWEHRWLNTFALRSFYVPTENSPDRVKTIFEMESAEDSYNDIQRVLNDAETEYYLSGVSPYQYEHRYERSYQLAEKIRNYSVVILITEYDLNHLSEGAVNKFYNNTFFTPLYEDEKHQTYIFGVNTEPGVLFEI